MVRGEINDMLVAGNEFSVPPFLRRFGQGLGMRSLPLTGGKKPGDGEAADEAMGAEDEGIGGTDAADAPDAAGAGAEADASDEIGDADEIDAADEADEPDVADEADGVDEIGDGDAVDDADEADEVDDVDKADEVDEVDEADEVDEVDEADEIGEVDAADEIDVADEIGEVDGNATDKDTDMTPGTPGHEDAEQEDEAVDEDAADDDADAGGDDADEAEDDADEADDDADEADASGEHAEGADGPEDAEAVDGNAAVDEAGSEPIGQQGDEGGDGDPDAASDADAEDGEETIDKAGDEDDAKPGDEEGDAPEEPGNAEEELGNAEEELGNTEEELGNTEGELGDDGDASDTDETDGEPHGDAAGGSDDSLIVIIDDDPQGTEEPHGEGDEVEDGDAAGAPEAADDGEGAGEPQGADEGGDDGDDWGDDLPCSPFVPSEKPHRPASAASGDGLSGAHAVRPLPVASSPSPYATVRARRAPASRTGEEARRKGGAAAIMPCVVSVMAGMAIGSAAMAALQGAQVPGLPAPAVSPVPGDAGASPSPDGEALHVRSVDEAGLDTVVATWSRGGSTHEMTAREAIELTGSLESMRLDDGTYALPSADDILDAVRDVVIRDEARARGIDPNESDVEAWVQQAYGTDVQTLASQAGMSEQEVMRQGADRLAATMLRREVVGADAGTPPVEPPLPDGGEGDRNELYASYIIELAGDAWDWDEGGWVSSQSAIAQAVSPFGFDGSDASHEMALAAYDVAYQRWHARSAAVRAGWEAWLDGILCDVDVHVLTATTSS